MKQIILASICAVTFMASCIKGSDPISGSTVPKIKRLMFVKGNINNIDFYYDNLDRVTSIDAYYGNSPINVPLADSICYLHFYYSGNSTLPSHFFIKNFNNVNYMAFHKIKYNASKEIEIDSIFFYNGTLNKETVFHFSNNLLNCHTEYKGIIPLQGYSTSINIANGNFTTWNNFEFYDFDNKINPLNSLNIATIGILFDEQLNPSSNFWSVWTLCNKNNIIRVKRNFNPILNTFLDTVSTLSYDYNSDGLVQTRYWGMRYQDTVDVIKYVYQ